MPRSRAVFALLLACQLASSGCALWGGGGDPAAAPKFSSRAARESWWRSNKSSAEFVPGQGYKLAGVEGYFDGSGRPMQAESSVAQASYETYDPTDVDDSLASSSSEESWLESLDPAVSFKKLSRSFGPAPDAAKARETYQEAEKLFAEKSFDAAAAKFKEAMKLAPDSALEEDCMFMLAECQFFADRYSNAIASYDELIKKYPNSRHMDLAINREFAIGRYWQKHHEAEPHYPTTINLLNKTRPYFDTYGNAIKSYENIRLNDPTGPLADDAIMATANAHFIAGRYEDADYNYALLRSEYPESEHQFQAHLLGLQCKLRKYQGPDYDGMPLDEGGKLVDQLLKQFPDKIDSERERVVQAQQQIARERALRDWSRAEYHDNLNQYGAAKYYYAQIIEKHSTTKLADAARARMGEIQGEPDVPPQQLEWLVNLFPDREKNPQMATQSPDTVQR